MILPVAPQKPKSEDLHLPEFSIDKLSEVYQIEHYLDFQHMPTYMKFYAKVQPNALNITEFIEYVTITSEGTVSYEDIKLTSEKGENFIEYAQKLYANEILNSQKEKEIKSMLKIEAASRLSEKFSNYN